MQQSAYSYGGGARGSPVAAGGSRDSAKRDAGRISAAIVRFCPVITAGAAGVSASAYFASAATGTASDVVVQELRREVPPLKHAARALRMIS